MSSDAFSDWVSAADAAMIAVTAAGDGDELDACLVGFHSQASIDPPRYVVWMSNANRTSAIARNADVLGIHLLRRDQHKLAQRLGSVTQDDEPNKLAGIEMTTHASGAVVLERCSAWFAGRVVDRFDGGDHRGFLLEPVDAACPASFDPLRLHAASDIDAGHPAD